MTDTTVEREAEPESLAPAVTRAALILDVLAESATARPSGRASSRGGSASRSRRSPTSAARSPTRASSGASGPGSRSGAGWPSSAARTSARSTRSRSSTTSRAAAGGVRGDGPVRGPRRARGHVPRAPRRAPAGPPDVGHRPAAAGLLDRDRQGGARVAAARRARPPARRPDHARPAQPAGARDGRLAARRPRRDPRARLRDRRRGDHGGRRLLRRDDPRPPAGRGSVRRQHHAAQGARDARARPGPARRPARAGLGRCRTRSAGR